MKKVLPVFLAVAAMTVAGPARSHAAQEAAAPSAQAADPEAAANEAYKAWKNETDATRKAALGREIVTKHFGSKAAEAVAYAGMFTEGTPDQQVLEMSRAYYQASKSSGKEGSYFEYALGNLAAREKEPQRAMQYSQEYMQKYPSGGKFTEYVSKNVPALRYQMFQSALEGKRYPEAIQYANEAFASGQNEFVYAYLLTANVALPDLSAQGAKSQFVGQAPAWAERVARFIESGKVPEGTKDPAEWDKSKPAALALAYKVQGMTKFFQTAQSSPTAPEAYAPAIDLLGKSAAHNEKDPITHSWIAQARNAQYAIHLNRYNALSEEEKTAEAGQAVLAQVNSAADELIKSYIRVLAYAGNNQALKSTIEPPLVEVYKYRHPDTPEAWREEVQRVNGGAAATPANAR